METIGGRLPVVSGRLGPNPDEEKQARGGELQPHRPRNAAGRAEWRQATSILKRFDPPTFVLARVYSREYYEIGAN